VRTKNFSVGHYPAKAPHTAKQASRGRKPLLWGVILIVMVVWSFFAWFAYTVIDPVLAWLMAIVSGAVTNGQGVAEAFGGKPVGEAVRALDASGLIGQLLGLVLIVAKPAIVTLWVLGLAALAALPVFVSLARRLKRFG